MKALLQRVKEASVTTGNHIIARINKGLLVFLGITVDDDLEDINYLTDKIINLRIFENEADKFDLSLRDIKGEILLVPQFTLYGNCEKGRRPDFTSAAPVQRAKEIYDLAVDRFTKTGLKVESGMFQAHMEVHLINDGPVTMMLESK